jgi:hypothetical protein
VISCKFLKWNPPKEYDVDNITLGVIALVALGVGGVLVGIAVAWAMDWQRKREGK